jgi:hypothetical protein
MANQRNGMDVQTFPFAHAPEGGLKEYVHNLNDSTQGRQLSILKS